MKHPKKYQPTKSLRSLSRKERKKRQMFYNTFKFIGIEFGKAVVKFHQNMYDEKLWHKAQSMLETDEQYEARTGKKVSDKKWSFQK